MEPFLADDDQALEAALSFVDEFELHAAADNEGEKEPQAVAESGPSWMPPRDGTAALTAAQTIADSIRARRRAADSSRRRRLRQSGVYANPNRARDERRLEIAYLREKVGQLETELQRLRIHSDRRAIAAREGGEGDRRQAATRAATVGFSTQLSSIWEGVATRQKGRREQAERENVRLKLILEGQIKVAKSLESLLLKRAQQHVSECASIRPSGEALGRTMDICADAADFQQLIGYLEAAYRDVDGVLAANGLANMELTQQDVQIREGVNGMYLEVFSNKPMPFGLRVTADATWNYFKGSKKHRGNLYAKEAQNLKTPYTIIEHFTKELLAGNSSTDVRIKQVVRRYVEAEREVVMWVAIVAPLETTSKSFKPYAGFTSHHCNYAVIKRAKASTSEQELSLLQLVSHVTVKTKEDTSSDPKYIRVLTDVLLSNTAGNMRSDQELIENVLMDTKTLPH
ncbi:hypothetical protein PHYBOEH_007731 [Phytophthora boehmeriae]|uniref:M96 mating-specific protein family n=1 Tax=Phytophthora boehmeriae TaxID=109152 RepID=A0A8T1X8S7_9STRA|nr:hypothetical protein PHYBOEH_007731 [Phytophthora boehmeriae]